MQCDHSLETYCAVFSFIYYFGAVCFYAVSQSHTMSSLSISYNTNITPFLL